MMTKIYDATDDYIDCNNDADDYYGNIANYDDMMMNDMMTIMMRRATKGRRRRLMGAEDFAASLSLVTTT